MKIDSIDLTPDNKEVKVLSGRDKGEQLREFFLLDSLDKVIKGVTIVYIPDDIYSISSGYFLGLFGKSIRCLGELNFRKRYHFVCENCLLSNIDDGIKQALKIGSIF